MNALRWIRPRQAAAMAAGVLVLLAAAGWMHTRAGMAVLRTLGVPCPVDTATAGQVTRLREQGLAQLRGAATAPVRPALGLALDVTSEAQARAWTAAHGIACDAVERGLRSLRCRGFDAAALGIAGAPVSEMWLSFDAGGRLVGVDVYRRGLDDAGAALAWSDATRRLGAALGAPARTVGDPAPATLRATVLQTARIEYRYADYLARVTAVNLPHAGLAVREQYLSARSQVVATR